MSPSLVKPAFFNFIAYTDESGRSYIGHIDQDTALITPLAFASGARIENLYQVIEAGATTLITAHGLEDIPLASVTLLPPLNGRDILCVGKNYPEHAKEFNKSGYDSSDKVDQPTHPVIFTKRYTSIIASGQEILPQPQFTQTLDYEGEIGVIIGKSGYRIAEENAEEYVWGYTIINDVTARERQRDHKQFHIGKGADSYCPCGPIAVPKEHLPKTLRVQTFVNGEKRQDGTIDELIFSVSKLISTISEGQTVQAGDVIATGTPAGVGLGLKPPQYLQPRDLVEVKVTGLGTLSNRVATAESENYTNKTPVSHLPQYNLESTVGGYGLRTVNNKLLHVVETGSPTNEPIVYVHGLGATSEYWQPLISLLSLDSNYHDTLYDLEGCGLSPTSATSVVSIASYAADLAAIFTTPGVLVAHDMGCAVAISFALDHSELVKKLILLGPLPNPIPPAMSEAFIQEAAAVRSKGVLHAGTDQLIAKACVSKKTRESRPLAMSAARQFMLSKNPEGYAKACTALTMQTESVNISQKITCPVLVITGDEDDISNIVTCENYRSALNDCRLTVLDEVGHWHVTEDVEGVANAVDKFLKDDFERS